MKRSKLLIHVFIIFLAFNLVNFNKFSFVSSEIGINNNYQSISNNYEVFPEKHILSSLYNDTYSVRIDTFNFNELFNFSITDDIITYNETINITNIIKNIGVTDDNLTNYMFWIINFTLNNIDKGIIIYDSKVYVSNIIEYVYINSSNEFHYNVHFTALRNNDIEEKYNKTLFRHLVNWFNNKDGDKLSYQLEKHEFYSDKISGDIILEFCCNYTYYNSFQVDGYFENVILQPFIYLQIYLPNLPTLFRIESVDGLLLNDWSVVPEEYQIILDNPNIVLLQYIYRNTPIIVFTLAILIFSFIYFYVYRVKLSQEIIVNKQKFKEKTRYEKIEIVGKIENDEILLVQKKKIDIMKEIKEKLAKSYKE